MDKYKVIAEKITYSLDGYITDHNNRNFGDADGWLRHVRNGWEEFIEAHPDSLNLHEYLQHHQAKVDELKATIKGNHGRIAELERLNRVKAQAIINLHQEITEFKASHHGEVIGHEVHFKKIKQERDELQKRVQFLKQELGAWKGKSIAAMINGMCKQCGKEPWQAIVSDKEGYALLHCFGCGANKYELVGDQALKGEGQ